MMTTSKGWRPAIERPGIGATSFGHSPNGNSQAAEGENLSYALRTAKGSEAAKVIDQLALFCRGHAILLGRCRK